MDFTITKPPIKYPMGLTGKLPKNFNPIMIPNPQDGFIMLLTGYRGSGKSALLYHILKRFYKGCFDMVYIFNPSYGNDPTLSPESLELPEECFHTDINVDLIENVMNKQVEEKQEYDNGTLRKKHLSRILMVFDDCITDNQFSSNRNQNVMNKLGFRGRHYRISTIITTQVYNAVSARLRKNIPNHIIFPTSNKKERKAIIEELSGTMNEDDFEALFDEATGEQYNFFFIYGTCPDKTMKYRKNIDEVLKI